MQLVGLFFVVVPIALAVLGILCFLVGGLLSTSPRLRKIGFIVMLAPSMSLLNAAAGCIGFAFIAAELGDVYFFFGWVGGLMLGASVGLLLGCVASMLVCRRCCPAHEIDAKPDD